MNNNFINSNFFSNIASQFLKSSDNSEMESIANVFRKEYINFFHDNTEMSNITQTHWYTLFLKKKRLKNNNIDFNLKLEDVRIEKSEDSTIYIWDNDGRCKTCSISQEVKVHRLYRRNNKIIGKFDTNSEAKYSIMEALSHNDTYICPSCGHEGTLQSLIDGCDYCGTKFQIEELNKRVHTFHFIESFRQKTTMGIFKYLRIVLLLCFLGWIGLLFLDNKVSDDIAGNIIGVTALVLFLGVIFFAIGAVGFTISTALNKFSNDSQGSYTEGPFEKQVKQYDNLFSLNIFAGTLFSRIVAIHLADYFNEVSAFTKCDMTNLLPQYSNVIDCSLSKINYQRYYVDETYQYIDLIAYVNLLRLVNDKIIEVPEAIKLTLVKDKNAKSQNICEPTVLRCPNCGGSYNLLNGGHCEYCESELDLVRYDWVISQYAKLN